MDIMERTYQATNGKKCFDIQLKGMGYEIYVPYSQSCELMDIIDKGIRAMESERQIAQKFINDVPDYVSTNVLRQEVGENLIQGNRQTIERLDKLIDIGYTTLQQMDTV